MSGANPPPLPSERKCSHARFWVVIVLLSLALLATWTSLARRWVQTKVVGLRPDTGEQPEDERPRVDERWSYGDGDIKAVRIGIEGLLQRTATGWLGGVSDPLADTLRQIRAAQNDEDVRVLLVEIDSPGGELTASDELHRAIRNFRESHPDRRVVAFIRGLAASGGYYVAVAADRIVAEPTAIVGSISVLLQALNWHELSDRIGVTDVTIRSGRHKDLLNPFRPVQPEHLELLQRIVDDAHARFETLVARGRGLSPEKTREVSDGRVFTAGEALTHGLVDRLGYWEDAVAEAEELTGESLRIVRYRMPRRWTDWLLQLQGRGALTHNLWSSLAGGGRGPRLWALWQL